VGPVIATMNLRPENFRGDHLWMITAIAGSSLRGCSARGQHPLAVQSRALPRACGRPNQESGYAIWDYRPCHYRNFLITM
jgi:hypothetical protein